MQTLALILGTIAALAIVAAIVLYLLWSHARAEVAALAGRVRVLDHDLANERAVRRVAEQRAVDAAASVRAMVDVERAAAQDAATKSGRLTTMIAAGQHAEALDEALRGL